MEVQNLLNNIKEVDDDMNRKLFHQARAQELVDYLNAEDDPDGWAYELEQGYNGPNKGVIGQYYIRVVDYSDGGYVIGYF
jgi:hypothetical protein|tara:strand:- start:678 stop:917 length:240 start_codon:yes stop_codon:yes gene_type:complete